MGRRVQRTSSQDLKHIILGPTKGKYFRPTEVCDEVYPGIMLGEASTALSTCFLKELKVTHVLNAAHGKNDRYNYGYVNTSFSNYQQAGIKFMGITAQDSPSYYLRSHFNEAADFMDKAVRSGGKVLCHCLAGISRSATLVAAYLMLKKGMNVEEALSTIRARRNIYPNDGFLTQLSDYDYELKRKSGAQDAADSSKAKQDHNSETLKEAPVVASTVQDENEMPVRGYNENRPVTRSGYPLTTYYYDYATKSRSRAMSEDRSARSYYNYNRARSASPAPSYYRTERETSVVPETDYYDYRRRAMSVAPRVKYMNARYSTTPVLSSYVSGTMPSQRVYYHSRARAEPFIFTGRMLSRPITNTYIRSMYPSAQDERGSLARTMTPSNNTYSSSSPYESYSYSSPYSSRSYSNYTRSDGPTSRFRQGVSSSIRYPALYPATYRHSYLTALKAC